MIALSLIKNKKFKLINKKLSKKVLPNQCRIEILYSGICASDIPRAFESMAYNYPLVMGHEFVGKIIETGKRRYCFCFPFNTLFNNKFKKSV